MSEFERPGKAPGIFSSYIRVLDPQPGVLLNKEPGLREENKCRRCNFIPFLERLENIQSHKGLDSYLRVIHNFPKLIEAQQNPGRVNIKSVVKYSGAKKIFQIARDQTHSVISNLPNIIRHDDSGKLTFSGDPSFVYILLEPDGGGPEKLRQKFYEARTIGFQNFIIGYVSHSQANRDWSAFLESENFKQEWNIFLGAVRKRGVNDFIFMQALPPCASTLWKKNLTLEDLRSRLNLDFRVMDNSSEKCPQNNSGYALHNNTNNFERINQADTIHTSVKAGELLLVF